MLALRLASALIGIPVVLGAVWLGGPWFIGLAGAIAVLGLREYHRLANAFTKTFPFVFAIALALGIAVAAATSSAHLALALAGGVAARLALHFVFFRGVGLVHRALGIAGPFYLAAPLSMAVLLREGDDGLEWTLTAILCTFAVDTAAFAVGKLLGKRPLAPRVSPGKTWEGTAGGILGGVGAALGLTLILELPAALWQAALFGLLLSLAAVAGDLAESWLKRAAGAKDSGVLVPGHGGVLDRMDSLLATITVTYLWVGWAL